MTAQTLDPRDREYLGRLVRETWVAWALEQENPKPHWLTGWDDLDAGQREVDMRIGEAVARRERAVAKIGQDATLAMWRESDGAA